MMANHGIDLHDHLEAPGNLLLHPQSSLESFSRREIEDFQLAAARMRLQRHGERIPVIAKMLDRRDPASFERFDDFVPLLLEEDAYKGYEPAWIDNGEFDRLTHWLGSLSTHDLSNVDMDGCSSLSEWCRRLDEQAGIFVCHSSGTSGTLSFVPRSQRDRDLTVDHVVWYSQPLFQPNQRNDVTYFCMQARRQYRITQPIYDGLEQRYRINPVQALTDFLGPEFFITQGRLRKATASGTLDACLKSSLVRTHREAVERYQRDLPELINRWTDNLVENHRGRRIFFQGSFDKAWQITQRFRQMGITGAFAPESVFSLFGGVKDGSRLPDDWQEQFRQAMGVDPDHLVFGWGMSEMTGALLRCPHGMFHFMVQMIPFLLEPGTRRPLPRTGVQTGQLAILELISEDCWGGVISGDCATVHWDRACNCGRDGPLLDPQSIRRL